MSSRNKFLAKNAYSESKGADCTLHTHRPVYLAGGMRIIGASNKPCPRAVSQRLISSTLLF